MSQAKTPEQSASLTTVSISEDVSESKQTKQFRQNSQYLSKEEIFLALRKPDLVVVNAIVGDELNDENFDFLIAWFKKDISEMIDRVEEGAFLPQVYTWFMSYFNNQKFSKENSAHFGAMLEVFEFVNACNEVQDANGKELFWAVLEGDEDAVNDLLKSGVSPNVKDSEEQELSPLMVAAWQWDLNTDIKEITDRYVRIGRALLKHGANSTQMQQWVEDICKNSPPDGVKRYVWQGIGELIAEFVTYCSPVESKANSSVSSSGANRRPLQPLAPSAHLRMFSSIPERKLVAGGRSLGQKSQAPMIPGRKKIVKRDWEVRSDEQDNNASLQPSVPNKLLSEKEQQLIVANVSQTR